MHIISDDSGTDIIHNTLVVSFYHEVHGRVLALFCGFHTITYPYPISVLLGTESGFNLTPKPRNVPMFEISGVTLVAIATITMKKRRRINMIKTPMKSAICVIHTAATTV